MKKNPWKSSKKQIAKTPQTVEDFLDSVLEFVKTHTAKQALVGITAALGMIFSTSEDKNLEEVRNVLDTIKASILSSLSKQGWK